ncbi:MAG: FG-GAP repeat protein [Candidatus Eisenbacteria bacterium]|nr:FG-GAP repeat protein [Candidatus Eisenbacteria bacterium]
MSRQLLWSITIVALGVATPAGADVLREPPLVVREGNVNNANVGTTICTAGDVNGDGYSDVIVGAPSFTGTFYCYHGGANPSFGAPAWTASGAVQNEWFNARPAPAGDLNGDGYDDVLIGAPLYENGQDTEGGVFVYLGSSTGLQATPQAIIEGNVEIPSGAGFGGTVDAAGDVNGDGYDDIVVGSSNYTNGETREGRIAVYYGSASGATTSAAWTFESGVADSYFGSRVAGVGDVNGDGYADVAASAPFLTNGQLQEGRLYLFLGSPSGPASTPSWTYESNNAFDEVGLGFGFAGDVNGDGYSDLVSDIGQFNVSNSGAIVFFGSATGLAPTHSRKYALNHGGFGDVIYTAGDVNGDGCADIIASEMSAGGNTGQFWILGGAENSGTTLPVLATRTGGQTAEGLGWDARPAGDVNGDGFSDVIVSSPNYDNGQTNEGIVRLYLGQGSMPADTPIFAQGGTQVVELYGVNLAQGDWNGDGFTDLAIGRPLWDFTSVNQGIVSVYYGGESGYSLNAYWSTGSNGISGLFGSSVGNAGDVDNDGDDDLIVGESGWGPSSDTSVGRAHLFLGSPQGLPLQPAQILSGEVAGGAYGRCVDGAGDVNGDGYADVLVAAPTYDSGAVHGGKVYLYAGSPSGLVTTPVFTWTSGAVGDELGWQARGLGDLDGDGYSDYGISAPRRDTGFTNQGVLTVYFGGPTWVEGAYQFNGNQTQAQIGKTITPAGDLNGDGYGDFAYGASLYDSGGQDNRGAAFIYYGQPNHDLATGPVILGPSANYLFATSVAGGGDVNNDGYSDLLIGGPYDDSVVIDGGKAYLYLGSAAGLNTTPAWTHTETEESGAFSYSCVLGGDATGDGFADLVIGQPWYGPNSEGRVTCFLGARSAFPSTEVGGVLKLPRQFRSNGTTPVALGGRSDFMDGFRLSAVGRNAGGRARVQMRYQVAPAGSPFGGVQLGAEFDTGAPTPAIGSGLAIAQLASGLNSDRTYHWRVRFTSDSPYFPGTAWVSIPGNGAGGSDLRTGPAPTDVADEVRDLAALSFSRVGTNPLRDAATLQFALAEAGWTSLTIHDVSGRRITTLVDRSLTAGSHTAAWNALDDQQHRVPTGVYFARLAQGEAQSVTKVIVRR